jgi:hypothetical protein
MVFPFGTNVSNILGYCHGSQGRQVSSINAPTFTSDMKFQSKMPLRPNASAAHHRFREDARAPQVFGIGRIEPFLGGDHQKPSIGRALGDDFLWEFEVNGERN